MRKLTFDLLATRRVQEAVGPLAFKYCLQLVDDRNIKIAELRVYKTYKNGRIVFANLWPSRYEVKGTFCSVRTATEAVVSVLDTVYEPHDEWEWTGVDWVAV